jgi:tripartite-type tricarboxylate transporter receptor subunit TctC
MTRAQKTFARIAGILAVAIAVSNTPATADDFYKDKTISIIVSTGASGSYDGAARSLARYMPQYIPGNPTIVVKNMPGGGHTLATNFVINNSPSDGLTIGNIGNSIPMHQMVDGRGVRFDVAKFQWLGSIGLSNLSIIFWRDSGLTSIDDAYKREIVVGATGAGSGTFLYPNAMNKLLGTRFKIVTGYRTGAEVDLAMQRGEVQGRGGVSYSNVAQLHPDLLRAGKFIFVAQIGLDRDKAMPDAPLITELARDEEARQVLRFISTPVKLGRPYFVAPGVPANRVATLRKAFEATLQDKAFLAEGEKQALDIQPVGWTEIEKVVFETVKTPPAILEKVKTLVGTGSD